jgi:hypothetical protein
VVRIDMKARVAIIKDDYTWEEKIVDTGGPNFEQAADNAKYRVWSDLGLFENHKLPEHILGVCVLRVDRGKRNIET